MNGFTGLDFPCISRTPFLSDSLMFLVLVRPSKITVAELKEQQMGEFLVDKTLPQTVPLFLAFCCCYPLSFGIYKNLRSWYVTMSCYILC